MAEYSVRRMDDLVFEIAKFEWHAWPEVVYRQGWNEKGEYFCTCPARGNCKHGTMVRAFVKLGSPIMNCFWVSDKGELNGYHADISSYWKDELERLAGDGGTNEGVVKRRRCPKGIRSSKYRR